MQIGNFTTLNAVGGLNLLGAAKLTGNKKNPVDIERNRKKIVDNIEGMSKVEKDVRPARIAGNFIFQWLKKLFNCDTPFFKQTYLGEQKNDYDCGRWVCAFIEALISGRSVHEATVDSNDINSKINDFSPENYTANISKTQHHDNLSFKS